MPRITISYRRDDSLDITGRIFDRLAGRFGREAVFRDIDNIPPGADFRRHIDGVLDESDIVLAIVGPRWVGPDDEQRRLASPADPVRLEIETALRKNKPLLPVLVSRALMPAPDALPDSLRDFAYRNAVQVDSGQDFDIHVGRLISGMERILRIGDDDAATDQDVMRTIEATARIKPPAKPEPPFAPVAPPVGRPVRANLGHTPRWAIGLRLVAILVVISVGGWWVLVERPAEMVRQETAPAEKALAEEQAHQAAAKAQQEEQARLAAEPNVTLPPPAEPSLEEAVRQLNAAMKLEDEVKKGDTALDNKDYAEAMRWYRKAADQGDTGGQYAVGVLYENGWGVRRNLEQAIQWWRKAAEAGNDDAKKALAKYAGG